MAGEALFLGWGQVVRGREQRALQVFQESIAYYGKLQEDGQIDGFETFLLAPHSGDLNGFIMMLGEQSKLDAVRSSPEFLRIVTRAGAVVDNVGVVSAYTGEALGQMMALFGSVSEELPTGTTEPAPPALESAYRGSSPPMGVPIAGYAAPRRSLVAGRRSACRRCDHPGDRAARRRVRSSRPAAASGSASGSLRSQGVGRRRAGTGGGTGARREHASRPARTALGHPVERCHEPTLANSTAFILRVPERNRAAFERRTGLALVESQKPGVTRAAARRPMHLVLIAYQRSGGGAAPLGIDLAANALRRNLLLKAERTGQQLATPPVEFLTRRQPTRGVVVYLGVRDRRGRFMGWVSATYETQQLASMVTTQMPGVRLAIHDGTSTLIPGPETGHPAVIDVAGRRWSVWATVPTPGTSAVPWLVLGFGLALVAAVMLILRQAKVAARRSTRELEQRDAEEAALGRITTLVAQGESPDVVFMSVAEQVAVMLNSCTAAVSRFDEAADQGTILGGWSDAGLDLTTMPYALDGVTASAEVSRTGRSARTSAGYASSADPITARMTELGGRDGIAAPITVAGKLWGALGAAYRENQIPTGVEVRLERFASLVGLAISNADAWDRLERQASTDPLTGIANRRTFHERLTAEVARAERYGRHLSLALMDLDRFKAVNDLHGHPSRRSCAGSVRAVADRAQSRRRARGQDRRRGVRVADARDRPGRCPRRGRSRAQSAREQTVRAHRARHRLRRRLLDPNCPGRGHAHPRC